LRTFFALIFIHRCALYVGSLSPFVRSLVSILVLVANWCCLYTLVQSQCTKGPQPAVRSKSGVHTCARSKSVLSLCPCTEPVYEKCVWRLLCSALQYPTGVCANTAHQVERGADRGGGAEARGLVGCPRFSYMGGAAERRAARGRKKKHEPSFSGKKTKNLRSRVCFPYLAAMACMGSSYCALS
jgi:hypothetical protein